MALYFKRVEENGEKKRAIALYNGSAKFITQSANEFKEYSLKFVEPLYFDDVNFLPYEKALQNYHSFFNKFDLAHEDKIYGVENFKGDIYKNLKGEAIFTRKDWGNGNKFESNTLIGALMFGCDKLLSLGQMGGRLKEVYSSRYLPFENSAPGTLGDRQIKAIYENYGFEITGTLDGNLAKYFDIYINFSSYASFYKYGAWLFLKLKKEFIPFEIVEIFIAGKQLLYKNRQEIIIIKADESIDLTAYEKAVIYAYMLLFDREIFYVIDELIEQKKDMGNKIYPYGYQGAKKIERKIPKVELPQEAQKEQNKNTLKDILDNQKYIYGDSHVFNLGEIYHIKDGEIFFHAGVEDDIKKELEKHLAIIKEKINEQSNKEYARVFDPRNIEYPHYIEHPSDATLKALTLHAFFKGEYPINITIYIPEAEHKTKITPNGDGKENEPDKKPELMKDEYAISANFANGILTLRANRDYFISDKIKFGVKYQKSGVIYEFIGAKELKIYHYGANGHAFNFEFTNKETRENKEYFFRAEFKIKSQGQTKFPVKKDEFRFLNNDVFKNNERAYILHKKIGDKIHFNDDTHKAKIYLMGAALFTRDYGNSYRKNL